MNTLYDYNDHREYIADALINNNITASNVALQLNLKSKSYLGLIMRGKKRFQTDQIHIFRDLFKMSASEFEYFFYLVLFNNSEDSLACSYYKGKLEALRYNHKSVLPTDHGKEEVLAQWYYPALLLYTTLKKKLPIKDLSNSLGVSIKELEEAIQNLQKLGLLKSSDGHFTPKIKVAKKSWSLIQRRFLRSQIKNAFDNFDKNYDENGKYYSQTITFSQKSVEEVWDLIKDKMDELADRSDVEPAEELMQLNVQFYKLI